MAISDGLENVTPFVPPVGTEAGHQLPLFNPKDLRVLAESASEVVNTLVVAPVDQPVTFRTSQRKVANVFTGFDIDVPPTQTVKSGLATLVEVRHVLKDTLSDSTCLLPIRVGLTVTAPAYAGLTSGYIQGVVMEAVSAFLYEPTDGDLEHDRITDLLHGVVHTRNVD